MKLLITGAWVDAKQNIDIIKNAGNEVMFLQNEQDVLPCDYEWAEGVICNGLFLYHNIERFSNLKYIQLTSAGYDRIPLEYINDKNIALYNAKGVYSIPIAEYVIATVLQIYKQMRFFDLNQKMHKWEKNRGLLELFGKKVCIVGCGNIGRECAKRFKAFGCQTIGIGQYKRNVEHFDEIYTKEEFTDIVKESDITVLAVPLNEETNHLVDDDVLKKMKDNSIIVNISRGAVIDITALEATLKTKPMFAVLDVFDTEPLGEDSHLWDMANVVITPHNSFVGEKNNIRLRNVILNNLNVVEDFK